MLLILTSDQDLAADYLIVELTRQLHNLPVRTSVRPAEHEVLEP